MSYIPFVYKVTNKTTNRYYHGSKYSVGANPECLWTTYFTSSSSIHSMIALYGKDDWIVEVIAEYPNDPKGAVRHELELLRKYKGDVNSINMCYSTGLQDLEIASKAGKIGGAKVKKLGLGIFNQNNPRYYEWCANGGKAGGSMQLKNKIGIHAQTREERLILSSKGGIAAIPNSGFKDPVRQADRGRRGGVKNKGFVWINDGTTNFKYTTKQQQDMSIDDYVQKMGMQIGRKFEQPKATCPHCGASGISITIKRTHFDKCKERK